MWQRKRLLSTGLIAIGFIVVLCMYIASFFDTKIIDVDVEIETTVDFELIFEYINYVHEPSVLRDEEYIIFYKIHGTEQIYHMYENEIPEEGHYFTIVFTESVTISDTERVKIKVKPTIQDHIGYIASLITIFGAIASTVRRSPR